MIDYNTTESPSVKLNKICTLMPYFKDNFKFASTAFSHHLFIFQQTRLLCVLDIDVYPRGVWQSTCKNIFVVRFICRANIHEKQNCMFWSDLDSRFITQASWIHCHRPHGNVCWAMDKMLIRFFFLQTIYVYMSRHKRTSKTKWLFYLHANLYTGNTGNTCWIKCVYL